MIDATGLDERQHLEHLDGRADEGVVRGIAGAGRQSLLGMRDRYMHAMLRLDDVAAPGLDGTVARLHQRGTHASDTNCTDTPPRLGFTSTRSSASADRSHSADTACRSLSRAA